jgi:recombination protein RecT
MREERSSSTAVTTTVRSVGDMLEKLKPRMAGGLPKHLTAERLIRVAQTAMSRNPRLLECTQESLIYAIMEAGQLGLEPGGVMGHAYLVPYKNKGVYEAQFMPGYRGLVDLVLRGGDVGSIEARVVRSGDTFDYVYGLKAKLDHVPGGDNEKGSITHVYAIARFKDGRDPQFEVMTVSAVERIRERSRARTDGPWVTDYEWMAKKTVIKQLCKLLRLSPEAENALAIDNSVEAGNPVRLAALDPQYGHLDPEEPDVEIVPDDARAQEIKDLMARQKAENEQQSAHGR